MDAVSIVRSCLIVTTILNKGEDKKWLTSELSGKYKQSDLPKYRNVSSSIMKNTYSGDEFREFDTIEIYAPIHSIIGVLNSNFKTKEIRYRRDDGCINVINEMGIHTILNSIIDRCLFLLNDIILELQYGGVVEYLMEEIRKNTDEKLIAIDPTMKSEIQSLFNNLTSTNKADWNKVGHSCRKLLKLVADKVFPPSDDMYTFKDKTTREVKENMYINRLCAFIDQKTSDYERSFELSEINYFEKYLRESNEFDNVGEHKESIEKYQADMMAIHTYLIISEILRYYKV